MKLETVIGIVFYAVIAIVSVIFFRLIYHAVMATDWPDWVKFMVLKG